MSVFWSAFIIILTVASILGCCWLIISTGKPMKDEPKLKSHVWDGDLQEYNNPLPRWWLWLFNITIVFAVGYMLLYPGFGNYPGLLNWSTESSYQSEVDAHESKFASVFSKYADQSIAELSENAEAVKVGRNLFANHCAACHGTDAKGSKGFPDLTDNDWLYGDTPDKIKASILGGRKGIMVPMGAALGDEGIQNVIQFIKSFNDKNVNPTLAKQGEEKFKMLCSACHGADAKGNQLIGAPNLTDDIWLYGSSDEALFETITKGQKGVMPAHKDILSEDKINLISAYVLQLSQQEQ